MTSTDKPKARRGFAVMDPAKQREIAAKGGRSLSPEQRSFSQDRSLASAAGQKGGQSVRPERRSFSMDRNLAASAGRVGGSRRPSAS